jgi:4-methylaminobutanoate oxidase (formaldehyde-forming)
MGPRSRALLSRLSDATFAEQDFPFGTSRQVGLGHATVRATRITYVGELGWELYVPTEFAVGVYEDLMRVGADLGVVDAGYYAIESMRLEKGYRAWGSDLTPETTPEAAGVGFAVRLDKPAAFIGKAALQAERAAGGPAERLVCLVLDDARSVCLGSEPVRIAGELCGRVTSGGYGSRVRRSIALAYVPAAHAAAGTRAEVEVFGEWVPAEIAGEALYDQAGERIRA